jgi:hypothetical protein
VNIFSSDRYSGLAGNGIDYCACGVRYAHLGIVITNPQEKHLYIFRKNKGAFPLTLIIGKITVEAHVNGDAGTVQKVEFYVDNHLQSTVTETPYTWSWSRLSIFKHTIKIVAYYDSMNTTSNQMIVWKVL